MKAVVQRVKHASVMVDGTLTGAIEQGLLVYLGVVNQDDEVVTMKMADKISKLRIFADEAGKMNKSVADIGGQILVVSQFTLFADLRQGNRPYFGNAGEPEHANKLYGLFVQDLRSLGYTVATGQFAADMKVSYLNDGPITIIVDSDAIFKK